MTEDEYLSEQQRILDDENYPEPLKSWLLHELVKVYLSGGALDRFGIDVRAKFYHEVIVDDERTSHNDAKDWRLRRGRSLSKG